MKNNIAPGIMLTQAASLLLTIPAANLLATSLSGTVTYATMFPESELPPMATVVIDRFGLKPVTSRNFSVDLSNIGFHLGAPKSLQTNMHELPVIENNMVFRL